MTNTNIPQVSEKDTKATIISKFEKVVELLKAKDAGKLDPAKEVAQKAAAATLVEAKAVVSGGFDKQIVSMAETVTKALNDTLDQLNSRTEKFATLDEAIAQKETELKELFGIEKSAYALAALIDCQAEAKEAFEADMAERQATAQEKLNTLLEDISARREAFNQEIKQQKADLDAERRREKVDYDYNLKRERKLAQDKWDDEMALKRKQFNEELDAQQDELDSREKELDAREETITGREDAVEDLEAKVAAIPEQIQTAVEKAVKDAKASEARSYGFEKNLLTKTHEGEKNLLQAKVETLENALEAEKARTANLETKLDEAYAKIESISGKAVEAASGVKYIDRLETMTKEQGKLVSVK